MNHVFVTGTGSGLGKAIAETLLQQGGYTVHGMSRQQSIEHARYLHTTLDLSHAEAAKRFAFPVIEASDRVVLVNNAGLLGDARHLGDLDAQGIVDTYMVNVVSPAVLVNAFVNAYKHLPAVKIIINLSSGAAQSPYDGWSTYCSSKAGLEMLTKVGDQEQQLDALPYPFQFFSIAPGVVDTGMQDKVRQSDQKGFSRLQKFINLKNEGQLYKAEDVAREFARIIADTSLVPGAVHRIVL